MKFTNHILNLIIQLNCKLSGNIFSHCISYNDGIPLKFSNHMFNLIVEINIELSGYISSNYISMFIIIILFQTLISLFYML